MHSTAFPSPEGAEHSPALQCWVQSAGEASPGGDDGNIGESTPLSSLAGLLPRDHAYPALKHWLFAIVSAGLTRHDQLQNSSPGISENQGSHQMASPMHPLAGCRIVELAPMGSQTRAPSAVSSKNHPVVELKCNLMKCNLRFHTISRATQELNGLISLNEIDVRNSYAAILDAKKPHARIPSITCPCTSVSRRSTPLMRKVSFV